MAGQYTQNFSLVDIFNNQKLKGKLPMINYKETEKENGLISVKTGVKTINRMVFDISTSAARPFYKGIDAKESGDTITISGNLQTEEGAVIDAVYNALLAQRLTMIYTANNADIIRSALKESQKNKRLFGINTKLYLRAQSMAQIEGMSNKEVQALLNDIMENILFGDDFPKTQEKYGVQGLPLDNRYDYKQLKLRWKFKVGAN